MKTIGEIYEEIEDTKKVIHDLGIIINDFPKGCYVYDTIKSARNIAEKYLKQILDTEVE